MCFYYVNDWGLTSSQSVICLPELFPHTATLQTNVNKSSSAATSMLQGAGESHWIRQRQSWSWTWETFVWTFWSGALCAFWSWRPTLSDVHCLSSNVDARPKSERLWRSWSRSSPGKTGQDDSDLLSLTGANVFVMLCVVELFGVSNKVEKKSRRDQKPCNKNLFFIVVDVCKLKKQKERERERDRVRESQTRKQEIKMGMFFFCFLQDLASVFQIFKNCPQPKLEFPPAPKKHDEWKQKKKNKNKNKKKKKNNQQ